MRQWLIRSVRSSAIMTVAATAGVFAQGPGAGQGAPMTMMQSSPVLNVIDVNHDGTISADELSHAADRLKTLD